jgi:transcription elongation factor Elf1
MNDLIFCCPRCFQISVAATVDDATVSRCRKIEITVDCSHCGQPSVIDLTETMRTISMRDDGEFVAAPKRHPTNPQSGS